MRVAPPERRSSTVETPEGLVVSIPVRRNILVILLLSAWLTGWAFAEVSLARELFLGRDDAPSLFLGAGLIAWTIGGGLALYGWCWMLKGREVLVLRSDALVSRRAVWALGRTKEYDVQHVKNLRVAPLSWSPYDPSGAMQFWGMAGGPIAFDYGAQTVRMAIGVDEAEARVIVKELKSRHTFPEEAA
jgi:hypothetical protein